MINEKLFKYKKSFIINQMVDEKIERLERDITNLDKKYEEKYYNLKGVIEKTKNILENNEKRLDLFSEKLNYIGEEVKNKTFFISKGDMVKISGILSGITLIIQVIIEAIV